MRMLTKMKPSKKTLEWAKRIEKLCTEQDIKIVGLKWTNEGWAVELDPIILQSTNKEEAENEL